MDFAELQKLFNTDPPVILKMGNSKWMMVAIYMAALIGLALMVTFASYTNTFVVLLFGSALLYALYYYVKIIIFPDDYVLLIDKLAFTIREASNESGHEWVDVSEFEVRTPTSRYSRTGVYFNDQSQPNSLLKRRSIIPGTNACPGLVAHFPDMNNRLPDNYGMPFPELAKLMNHWRERALAAK